MRSPRGARSRSPWARAGGGVIIFAALLITRVMSMKRLLSRHCVHAVVRFCTRNGCRYSGVVVAGVDWNRRYDEVIEQRGAVTPYDRRSDTLAATKPCFQPRQSKSQNGRKEAIAMPFSAKQRHASALCSRSAHSGDKCVPSVPRAQDLRGTLLLVTRESAVTPEGANQCLAFGKPSSATSP